MNKRLYINVTERDIALGIRRDSANCPIAQAIVREGLALHTEVGCTLATIGGVSYSLSKRAREFVNLFDAGYAVSPVKLYLTKVAGE